MPDEENNGRVSVMTLEKQEVYVINGSCKVVSDALAKFYAPSSTPTNRIIKLNGEVITNLDGELRNGDALMSLPSGLADGGVKGS